MTTESKAKDVKPTPKKVSRGSAKGVLSGVMKKTQQGLLNANAVGRILEIPLKDIEPDPTQVRKTFSDESLSLLASSIREKGLLQPITVFENPNEGAPYIIAYGERRWRSTKIAGQTTIKAVVVDNDEEAERHEKQLVENLQNEAMVIAEVAHAVGEMLKVKKGKEIALTLGKTAVWVSKMKSIALGSDYTKELSALPHVKDLELLYLFTQVEKRSDISAKTLYPMIADEQKYHSVSRSGLRDLIAKLDMKAEAGIADEPKDKTGDQTEDQADDKVSDETEDKTGGEKEPTKSNESVTDIRKEASDKEDEKDVEPVGVNKPIGDAVASAKKAKHARYEGKYLRVAFGKEEVVFDMSSAKVVEVA